MLTVSRSIQSIFAGGLIVAALLGGLHLAGCGAGGSSDGGGGGVGTIVAPPVVPLPPAVTTAITQVIADPANPGVQIILTSPNTLTAGALIVISGATNPSYNGTFAVISATPTTFTIATAFVADDTTAVWQTGGGVIAGCVTTGDTGAIALLNVPSRFTGVAPLGVFFDATGTTATAAPTATQAFHNLGFQWNFGDAGSGSWATGSQTGASRNTTTGPVAAHVFENPGTYTVTLSVTDGTNTVSNACVQIAVLDPSVVFAGANTVCLANATATAGAGGCPAAAATPAGTASLNTALASCTTGKRCLFKGGDSFLAGTTGIVNMAGPATLASYGAGTATFTGTNINVLNVSSGVSDLRIMDLNLVGSGVLDTGSCMAVGVVSSVTMLRVECHDIGKGIIIVGGASITESVIQDSHIYNIHAASGGVGIFGAAIRSAYLGNLVGPFGATAEHNIRLQPGQKVAVSNNTITTPGTSGKAVLTVRALDHLVDPNPDSQYVYISDNHLLGGSAASQMFQIGPAANAQNNWIYDVIAERNWIVFGPVTQQGQYGEATRVTTRNNICNASGGAAGRTCFSNDRTNTAGVPVPDGNTFYNNTCFDNSGAGSFFCITLGFTGGTTPITNTIVANNLAFAPSVATPRLLFVASSGVTGTVGDEGTFGNSSNAQVMGTNPNFLNASGLFNTPLDFKLPPAGSYAIGGGVLVPVWSDFFRVAEPSPRDTGAVNH